jgi:hypothetical protein
MKVNKKDKKVLGLESTWKVYKNVSSAPLEYSIFKKVFEKYPSVLLDLLIETGGYFNLATGIKNKTGKLEIKHGTRKPNTKALNMYQTRLQKRAIYHTGTDYVYFDWVKYHTLNNVRDYYEFKAAKGVNSPVRKLAEYIRNSLDYSIYSPKNYKKRRIELVDKYDKVINHFPTIVAFLKSTGMDRNKFTHIIQEREGRWNNHTIRFSNNQ